jgi:hypothetical protein
MKKTLAVVLGMVLVVTFVVAFEGAEKATSFEGAEKALAFEGAEKAI